MPRLYAFLGQARLFTQGIWQSVVVAKALESLFVFHANALARHLFHFFQLSFGKV
jgi:hypothetical protein